MKGLGRIHADDPIHHTLIYTSHEGTTHLYAPGLVTITTLPFLTKYRDQVNIWTSKNDGTTWDRVDFNATGFATNPANNVGFSDPERMRRAFLRLFGQPPQALRRAARSQYASAS